MCSHKGVTLCACANGVLPTIAFSGAEGREKGINVQASFRVLRFCLSFSRVKIRVRLVLDNSSRLRNIDEYASLTFLLGLTTFSRRARGLFPGG